MSTDSESHEFEIERVIAAEIRTITELDRPKRLACSTTVRGGDSEEPVSTEVGVSFEPRSGQTLVKLEQRGSR